MTSEPDDDRHLAAAPWLLALCAFFLNVPRLLLGPLGPLQRTDVADHYVDKFQQCGAWILAPTANLWNPWQVRGWGTLYGSVNPQHLGCALAAIMPTVWIFPVLQTVVDVLALTGAFLFARHTAGLAPRPAIYAALLHLVILHLHNENPYVTQVAFLPLLAFLTSAEGSRVPLLLLGAGWLTITMLSFPLYAFPLMPLAHIVVASLAGARRKRNAAGALLFWIGFTIFYLPNIAKYLELAPRSNRAFFHAGADTASFLDVLPVMATKFILYPALVAVIALGHGLAGGLWALGYAGLAAVQAAFQQSTVFTAAATRYPALVVYSPRFVYFVATAVFLAAVFALRRDRPWLPARWRLPLVVAWAVALACGLLVGWSPLRALVGGVTTLWLGGFLLADGLGRTRRWWTALGTMGLFLLPSFLFVVLTVESLPYGNLFLAPDGVPAASSTPQRVVTVVTTCAPHRIYAAQATVRGHETLDGVTVYHDRGFTERWWWYITRGATGCSRDFYHWSNRVELLDEDLRRRPDLVLQWLRVNNVAWIRSEVPLDLPGLVKVAETPTPRQATRTALCRIARHAGLPGFCRLVWAGSRCAKCDAAPTPDCRACEVPAYVYGLEGAFPRVFVLSLSEAPPATLEEEERLLRSLRPPPSGMVSITAYGPGRLEFEGAFSADDLVLVSTNAAPGWHVAIDGGPAPAALGPGVFGMIAIRPAPGFHRYRMSFDDGTLSSVALCAALSVVTFVAGAAVLRRISG